MNPKSDWTDQDWAAWAEYELQESVPDNFIPCCPQTIALFKLMDAADAAFKRWEEQNKIKLDVPHSI
jgi:hypothetical protein